MVVAITRLLSVGKALLPSGLHQQAHEKITKFDINSLDKLKRVFEFKRKMHHIFA